MLERLGQIETNGDPLEQWPYFGGTATSKDFLAAKKFAKNFVANGEYKGSLEDTPENIEQLQNFLEDLGRRLGPVTSTEEVINELRKANVITEPPIEKKQKKIEFIETNYSKLKAPKEVTLDEEQQKLVEANLLFEEIEKQNVFKSEKELETIYSSSLELHKNQIESESHYYEFAKAGLIKGGEEEVRTDLEALAQRKKDFETTRTIGEKEKNKLEQSKKIATITEQALAYAITELSWYGEGVTIEPVSEFDDIKRGVDDILEIHKEDDESSFLGLGVDVTFRGLYSEQFKQKFFNLLQSIHDGHKTKVKYFKNHKGELMREFAVPKMVLYFSVNDVKDMVSILRQGKSTQELQDNPQKVNVLRQIIEACEILSEFAEKCQNSIFRKYVAVLNSIKELAWKNEEVKKIIESNSSDEVSKHLRDLVEEFRLIKRQETAAAA